VPVGQHSVPPLPSTIRLERPATLCRRAREPRRKTGYAGKPHPPLKKFYAVDWLLPFLISTLNWGDPFLAVPYVRFDIIIIVKYITLPRYIYSNR
jgi:hypothetical protein